MTQHILRFAERSGVPAESIETLTGDVSQRRYFRLSSVDRSVIACLYPEGTWETAERFLRAGELLERVGVRVPQVLAVDAGEGIMLLEDLGEVNCYRPGEVYHDADRDLFARAAALVPRIQSLDLTDARDLLPPLDASTLDRELRDAIDALNQWSPLGGDLKDGLDDLRRRLGERIETMPLAAAHRDFMVRNLVPLETGEIAVLDHQDLRRAPYGYDYVSLMNDSLFPPHELADSLRRQLQPELDPIAYGTLASQRTLKAAGTYARAAVQGNPTHVRLIEATLARLADHLEQLEEPGEIASRVRSGRLRASAGDAREC